MALNSRFITLILTTLLVLGAVVSALAQDQTPAASPSQAESPYGTSYLPEELAAIDHALWGVNMTRGDLLYKRDYTEGKLCFPVVREWMHDPLLIAPWMDQQASVGPNAVGTECLRQLVRQSAGIFADTSLAEFAVSKGSEPPLAGSVQVPTTQQALVELMTSIAALRAEYPGSESERDLLRQQLPLLLAWHDVFTPIVSEEQIKQWEEELKDKPQDYIYTLADKADLAGMLRLYLQLPDLAILSQIPREAFPQDKPLIIDTENGRICLGTPKDDTYTGDFAVLIEPGGNDHYFNCRIGAAYGARTYAPRLGPDGEPTGASADYSPLGDGLIGYFVDLGGDDYYDCADVNISLGAAVLGVAAFYDLGQDNDRYYAGSCTMGAAMGGVATFYDDGGSDYYSGKVFTQGAAGFGIGIMLDESLQPAPDLPTDVETPDPIDWRAWDNDIYEAWSNAQAFARPRGVALCVNRRGNEVYHAGGVYLDAPLFSDRFQSFSQGFAIGEREIDYAGGIAMLIDYAGNDRYLGDIYNQGVGYWFSAGLLYDGVGNDSYEMTQYGQGSGIHLAVGGLIDGAGNDTYVMHSGLGQGSSHDLAVSILHDRGGDDRYDGNSTCNGAALAGATGIFIDRAGNDTYAGRRAGSINYADDRRINIGVFVDLAGDDDYMGKFDNGMLWRQGNIAAGYDIPPPPAPEGQVAEQAAAEPAPPPGLVIPEICSYQGALTQEVFDELWEISVRWEVGDNRWIVPKARARLTAFGLEVLPFMEAKMDNDNSGLAQRAYVDILQALLEQGKPQIVEMLDRNLVSSGDTRRRLALYLVGELKLTDLAPSVAALLDNEDQSLRRRAMGVLGLLGSHAGDDKMLALLDPAASDEPMLIALVTTLADLKANCFTKFLPLLDYPLFTVREQVVKSVDKNWDAYGPMVRQAFLSNSGMSPRALRTLLYIYLGAAEAPDTELIAQLRSLLSNPDWGVQSDVIRLARHWEKLVIDDAVLTALFTGEAGLEQEIAKLKVASTEPLVTDLAQVPAASK